MAKFVKSCSFSKAVIIKEPDGKYFLTEYDRDESRVYDLEQILDAFCGEEGISLAIKREGALNPSAEDELALEEGESLDDI